MDSASSSSRRNSRSRSAATTSAASTCGSPALSGRDNRSTGRRLSTSGWLSGWRLLCCSSWSGSGGTSTTRRRYGRIGHASGSGGHRRLVHQHLLVVLRPLSDLLGPALHALADLFHSLDYGPTLLWWKLVDLQA